ncbi:MAG: NADH-quinone oxidoreductase subunit J [Betaproteobacteria bacterium]|nr:NADH-quinone oxidoreductase subunit J [Betaproteobacteria bacterium]MCC7215355.1 NADH-quinone oxidoreductase subunit J [Burkholderiales bacterium]
MEALLQEFDTLLLYVFAGLSLAGAIAMLVLQHPMRVAMALVATMIWLGAIYGLVGVHFIAAFQILIYVSAVMVFIIYVIMLLDVRDMAYTRRYAGLLIPGAIAAVVFFGVLAATLWRTVEVPLTTTAAFGIGQFAVDFLQQYWLQFEVTSVLLVAAVVAAIAVVKAGGKDHG